MKFEYLIFSNKKDVFKRKPDNKKGKLKANVEGRISVFILWIFFTIKKHFFPCIRRNSIANEKYVLCIMFQLNVQHI